MKIKFLSKSRGPRNLTSRIFTVIKRFGISPKSFERRLQKYYEIMQSEDCSPTFAITAAVLARHPGYIKELHRRGVEFAVHGYVHIDYKAAGRKKKRQHFKKAMDTFKRCEIPFVGFRAPFLRTNEHTTPILNNLGFLYNSSRAMWWPVINIDNFSAYVKGNLKLLLDFYQPLDAEKYLSLPRLENGMVEIPVSLPDDEVLIERMGITDREKIGSIWLDILQRTYSRGELFDFSLHPERIECCENGLRELLRKAKEYNPPIWMATLREIAEWWQEKDKFTLNIQPQGDGRYRVKAVCSELATVLAKNVKVSESAGSWSDGYKYITARDFILESPKRPVIGMGANASPAAIRFLQDEGYILDLNAEPGECGTYLGDLQEFDEADKRVLLQQIEQSNAPILRYWRWPSQARSALAVTGDIDSITLVDFILRILENKWQK
jgi:hypothetical protein